MTITESGAECTYAGLVKDKRVYRTATICMHLLSKTWKNWKKTKIISRHGTKFDHTLRYS